jgi:hypothetical protein
MWTFKKGDALSRRPNSERVLSRRCSLVYVQAEMDARKAKMAR